MEQVIAAFRDHKPAMVASLVEEMFNEGISVYTSMPKERLAMLCDAAVSAFERDLASNNIEQFPAYWSRVAAARIDEGARLEEMQATITAGKKVLNQHMQNALVGHPDELVWWNNQLLDIIYAGVTNLGRVFLDAQEQRISAQAMQIRELSTPIIPLHTGVLALPIVGTLDAYRAGQVMELLLEGIAQAQAEVVIIDITGVPVVDTGVGHYLLQAARAAQMLGSKVILVGISAEIAQTIVQLGVELNTIVTRANMQSGIEYAFRQLGLEIRPIQR